ncbi:MULTISPECIES: endonuclease/exonuclease/phosphatase family protein [Bizionia]|nr:MULTISPECIES: endonuclease/exonuclease/phosphatase family protein [Bizionia]
MLDFPRIQLFIALFICLLLFVVALKRWKWYDYMLSSLMLLGLIINGSYLIHYTRLVSVEVPFAEKVVATDTKVSLLITNVKMTNRNAQDLHKLIALKQPDLILAMEVDKWWDTNLKVLKNDYPYSQHTTNAVTYGMVVYSKLPLNNLVVHYLNNKNVPSFESTITLESGKQIKFYSVHPVPPTHFKDLPDNAGQEENALKNLGKKISEQKLPVIVAGDLNEVVWSYVDELTGTKNVLYDVRVGRGFYNSYNAENPFMRWPLDHIFVTKEFKLKRLERLSKMGSDHFPILVELVL